MVYSFRKSLVSLLHETNTLYFVFLTKKPLIVSGPTLCFILFFWLILLFCSCLSLFSCTVSLGSMIYLVLLSHRAVNLYIALFCSVKIYWFIKKQSPTFLFILILEDAVICALTLDEWINYFFIYNMEHIKWWEHIRLVT